MLILLFLWGLKNAILVFFKVGLKYLSYLRFNFRFFFLDIFSLIRIFEIYIAMLFVSATFHFLGSWYLPYACGFVATPSKLYRLLLTKTCSCGLGGYHSTEMTQFQAFCLSEGLTGSCTIQRNSPLSLYDDWVTSFCLHSWMEIYFGTVSSCEAPSWLPTSHGGLHWLANFSFHLKFCFFLLSVSLFFSIYFKGDLFLFCVYLFLDGIYSCF